MSFSTWHLIQYCEEYVNELRNMHIAIYLCLYYISFLCFRACEVEAYRLPISTENTSGTMRAGLQDISHGAGPGRRDTLWSECVVRFYSYFIILNVIWLQLLSTTLGGTIHQIWDACPAELYHQTEGRGGPRGTEAEKQVCFTWKTNVNDKKNNEALNLLSQLLCKIVDNFESSKHHAPRTSAWQMWKCMGK